MNRNQNESKHTPGPWESTIPSSSRLTTRQITGPHDEPIASVGLPNGYTCGAFVDVANARLLAAAPELLEALQEAVTWMQTYRKQTGTGEHGPLGHSIAKARAAIAKAEDQA